MNRRTAIRNVVYVSAGAILLPACLQNSAPTIPLKNISVNGAQVNMLAELADAILPATKKFVGAKNIKAHEFVLMMVDECSAPEEQKIFVNGLTAFDKLCHEKFGQIFTGFTPQQKIELLNNIESGKNIHDDVLKMYAVVKRNTILAFTTSQKYLTDVKNFKLVPGSRFKGCVPVKPA